VSLSAEQGAVAEARRVMTICNACRYCEGLCAVFPAMERLAVFSDPDLRYLGNLCHDCRECFYACPFTPPHDFDLNVPRVFAELRRETYERHTKPAVLGRAYRRNGLAVALAAGVGAVLVPLLALVWSDPGVLRSASTGAGAFYEVVPMPLMVGPALVLMIFACVVLLAAGAGFWREIGGCASVSLKSLGVATVDALRLTYLGGGGSGCSYPEEGLSMWRRRLHHLVFWGFALDLAATTVAAFYEHALDRIAPYPLWSLPVVLGTAGGLLLALGTTGLLWLKRRSDAIPTDEGTVGMDVAFLALLWATSVSGLLLLALRETAWMPTLLLVHLGVVAGFFLTLPFGKFAHAVHRYLALVRHAVEEAADEAG